ncbi:MAG: FISUMP domain-containing protein [Bacteroidales bacterium]|nr:FISUMP domain-containing protein [Bacteroidales bacterium]
MKKITLICSFILLLWGCEKTPDAPVTTNKLTIPTVITAEATDISRSSATCGGNVTSDGNGSITARGVCWDTQADPSLSRNMGYTVDGTGMGVFESTITGLSDTTLYYYVAYATNEEGTDYGEVKDFITPIPCGELTVDYGGQTYHTVPIGDQCWMKENLNIGTRINGGQEQTNNGTIEKYCYGDNEANCDEYGGLYQWNEMMKYTTQQGTQGICPDGWHIPTDGEWTALTDFLGGEAVAGGKMKETGTAHWNSPNTGATNSSGFTALPGGYRDNYGYFSNLGNGGFFWSSSEYSATYAWKRELGYDNEDVHRYSSGKEDGFSVRCIKD